MDNYFSSVEPKVVIYLKKNQFEIGPKFTVLNDMNSSNVINGITLSYKYFPHPSSKYLDFFFLGNCSFTNNIRSEQRKYTDNAIVYNSIYNHMESFTTATIGYGFIFKIKQFYIEQSMSLGVGQYTETYKLDVTNLSSANYDNSKNNGYDLVKLIKVGIGYKF